MEQTPPARRRKYAASAIMMCFLMISLQSARSGEKDPHEMTALGVISENVREIYAREVEACYNEAGKVGCSSWLPHTSAYGAQLERFGDVGSSD